MMTDINLVTTIIGFGMSSTFIVFVCTRLICGRVRVPESRQAFDRDADIDLEQPEQRTDGLESVVVAAIPTLKYHREAFSSMEDAQCSICLGEYQEKEVLRIMPKCGHNFHLSCIDIWLMKQSTCPVCRLPLKDTSDKHSRLGILRSFRVTSPADDGELEHSTQAIPPVLIHSAGHSSSQHHQLTPSSTEPSLARELETRLTGL